MNKFLFLCLYVSIILTMLALIVGMIGELFNSENVSKWAFVVMFCGCALSLIIVLTGLLTSFPFAV